MADDTPWGPGESEELLAASPPRVDRRFSADELGRQHAAALAAGRVIEAALALARQAGRGGDAAGLRAFLVARAPALSAEDADEEAARFVRMSGHSLFQRTPQRARDALPPGAMAAILRGGTPAMVLRQLAIVCDQYGLPCLAADLIDAVVALEPGWTPPLFNRALIKMSLGDFFAARADIKTLREAGEEEWLLLLQYFQHLAGDWVFFPAVDGLAARIAAPLVVTGELPDPDDLVATWADAAGRLGALRRRLDELATARDVAPSFVPPTVPGDDGDDEVDASGIPDLLSDARLAWTLLAAMAWVSGGDEVVPPTGPPIAVRVAVLHAWAIEASRVVTAIAEGKDPGPIDETLTWARAPVASHHPGFASMKLVPLFAAIGELAAWLGGVELDEADDEDDVEN